MSAVRMLHIFLSAGGAEKPKRHGEATEMREGGGEEELLCGWVERRRSRGSGLEEDNAVFSLKKELNLS